MNTNFAKSRIKLGIKSSLTLFLMVMLVTACEKDVKIDLPYEGDKIVLNSFIMRDSIIYGRLTNSSQISTGSGFPVPAGAKIDLYQDDVLLGPMAPRIINGRQYFVSASKSIEGKKYTLKASATGLENAEGSDIIPVQPAFEGVEFKEISSSTGSSHKLEIKLKDVAGVQNFYRLRIYEADTNQSATGPRVLINKQYRQSFEVDNLGSNSSFDIFDDLQYDQIYFADDKFDGREISLTIEIDYYNPGNMYIAPELASLTKDAYRYLQSRENQFDNDGNPFTEAVIIYNNIRGGYGIVAGMADSLALVRKQ